MQPSAQDGPYAGLATRLAGLGPSCGATRVVAVDGPSAAGKSTFAAGLADVLDGAPVVGSDDFPVPWDGDPLAWWPPLQAQVLEPLRAGRTGRFRRYDWRRGGYAEQVTVPSGPFLVIEGVGAARLGAPIAFAIWVESEAAVRRRRAARRGAGTTSRPGTGGLRPNPVISPLTRHGIERTWSSRPIPAPFRGRSPD